MENVSFEKSRAEYLLRCLNKDRPLKPGPSGWTREEMLGLAGAIYFLVLSQGPMMDPGPPGSSAITSVRYQIPINQFHADLVKAIRWYSDLTEAVADNYFDLFYEPTVRALFGVENDADRCVVISGIKKDSWGFGVKQC